MFRIEQKPTALLSALFSLRLCVSLVSVLSIVACGHNKMNEQALIRQLSVDTDLSNLTIPIDQIVAEHNQVSAFKISPNGKKLAWIAVINGQAKLRIKTLATGETQQMNTAFINENFIWGDAERYLLVPMYSPQYKVAKIGLIDSQTHTDMRLLLPYLPGSLLLEGKINDNNSSLLLRHEMTGEATKFYQMSLSNFMVKPVHYRQVHDQSNYQPTYQFNYQFNYQSKAQFNVQLYEATHIAQFIMNAKGQAASIIKVNGARLLTVENMIAKSHGTKKNLAKYSQINVISECHDEEAQIKLLSIDNSGYLHYLSNCETNTLQLVSKKVFNDEPRLEMTNTALGLQKINAERQSPQFDVSQVLINPENGKPMLQILEAEYSLFVGVSVNVGVDASDSKTDNFKILNQLKGKNKILSVQQNGNLITLKNSSHLGIAYYLFDQQQGELTQLSSGHLSNYQNFIKPAEFIEIVTGNQTKIFGYYYAASQGNISENKAVILLHGGPETRSFADYDQTAILLSNRGYHVFSLNYRGSKGFGHQYKRAAYQAINVVLADIETTQLWLQANIKVKPSDIALIGESYGGYLALLANKFDAHQCIISINGIYDIYQTAINFPVKAPNIFTRYFGDIHTAKHYGLSDYLPSVRLNGFGGKVSNDKNSLHSQYLIIHSEFDQKIQYQTAVAYVNALQQKQPVNFVTLKDNHGIHNRLNRVKVLESIEGFLEGCL